MQFFGFCLSCHDQGMFFKETEKIFSFHTLLSNHLYLLLRQLTQILMLHIGNKYWQLFRSGLDAWLKNNWKPITCGLKIIYQKNWAPTSDKKQANTNVLLSGNTGTLPWDNISNLWLKLPKKYQSQVNREFSKCFRSGKCIFCSKKLYASLCVLKVTDL